MGVITMSDVGFMMADLGSTLNLQPLTLNLSLCV